MSQTRTFAIAGKKKIESYMSLLDKADATSSKIESKIRLDLNIKWGALITDEGAKFKEYVQDLKKDKSNKQTLLHHRKAAEQANSFLKGVVDGADQRIDRMCELCTKAITKVPKEFHNSLKPQIEPLLTRSKEMLAFQKEYKKKYKKSMTELKKLEKVMKAIK